MGSANQTAQINRFQVAPASSHAKVCPNCGHCPTCGRDKYRPYPPYYYPYYPYPYYQQIPYYQVQGISGGISSKLNGTTYNLASATSAAQPIGAISYHTIKT